MIHSAYCIAWTEYERGWGSRPDGKSYYKTKELAERKRKDFISSQPAGPAPDEYTSPGEIKLVEVDKKLWDEIQKKRIVWR